MNLSPRWRLLAVGLAAAVLATPALATNAPVSQTKPLHVGKLRSGGDPSTSHIVKSRRCLGHMHPKGCPKPKH